MNQISTPDKGTVLAGGRLEAEVMASLVDGRLRCPAAFDIAKKLKVRRRLVGDMANKHHIRIIDCQLGCFGLKKATHEDLRGKTINPALTQAVQSSSSEGMLPCPQAFGIARRHKVAPKEVCDAATVIDVKIVGCQLGCF